jgi:phosphoribosylformimino-5-aminoimidazole carboxamide ribotide isomerase
VPLIREAIVTTVNAQGEPHIAPLGLIAEGSAWILAPFHPSTTLDNLRQAPFAVANFTDDVRVFAGCLTGRRDWPLTPATLVAAPRLKATLSHLELVVVEVREHELRPRFVCRVAHQASHAPFQGFNRAQAAVIEGAVLVSRLHLLPRRPKPGTGSRKRRRRSSPPKVRRPDLRAVPVIDLMHGEVVSARMGDRASYRPLNSPLSPTSDAVDVVRGLLAVHPFQTVYVADLDAIQNNGDNVQTLRRIRDAFPALQLWVDNGAADPAAIEALIGADLGAPVIGSESQRDAKLIAQHRDSRRVVLSLDFRGETFQGPPEILAEPALWPSRVIVMTLARVGSAAGPDVARFAAIRSMAGGRELYAAGGVRDMADLSALKAAGASGALIATALHEQRIRAADLESM